MTSTWMLLLSLSAVVLTGAISMPTARASEQLLWQARAPCPIAGVHHPITFANETHAFLLTGSTYNGPATSEFYVYDEAADSWADLSGTPAAYPGPARSFGYGVVLPVINSTKAYLGFGAALSGQRLSDLWEFDMVTLEWKQLPDLPDFHGRRHPAMNAVRNAESDKYEIHVGLGDTYTNGRFVNLKDFWKYDIESETWTRLPDLPAVPRHHPFYFGIGSTSYAGFGHSPFGILRDWYALTSDSSSDTSWTVETIMASFEVQVSGNETVSPTYSDNPITTEGRVAGTQFSIELPLEGGEANLIGSLGFVISGDGEDHGPMAEGQFHAFYPAGNVLLGGPGGASSSWWRQLPPHPGYSRWAPGSFVMRGTARAYFTGGYDRALQILFSDLWMIDLSSLFLTNEETSTGNSATDAIVLGDMGIIDEPSDALAPPALEVEAFASPVIPTSSSARLGFMTITSVVAVSTMFQFLRC
jgi:hypothetical protein